MSHNQFQFIGNLTRDPEVHAATESAQARAAVDIAVNRFWRSNGERQKATDYFRIKAWGNQAENAGKYLRKGSLVFVEGRIESTKYEKEGETVYGNDFIADKIEYLDPAPSSGQA